MRPADSWKDYELSLIHIFILLALGASDETICQDFVRTNVCRRPELEKIWSAYAGEIKAHPEQKLSLIHI